MTFIDISDTEQKLIKAVSSNLIRAQMEENKDTSKRNRYLENASFESVHLSRLFLKEGNNIESSRYLMSAAYSFEKAEALNQAVACYNKIIEIEHQDFIDEAKEGLSRSIQEKKSDIDLSTKEGKLAALDLLVWKYNGLTTTQLIDNFSEEFDYEILSATVRNYAHELEERKRVIIWGGPQGREYHIYPNIANLATRRGFYGKKTMVAGSIESRITDNFSINFEQWYYNKELFILNGNVIPKMVMAIDMTAFVKNLVTFTNIGHPVKTFGILENFSGLASNGYETMLNEDLDVIDPDVIIDGNTEGTIYNRNEN